MNTVLVRKDVLITAHIDGSENVTEKADKVTEGSGSTGKSTATEDVHVTSAKPLVSTHSENGTITPDGTTVKASTVKAKATPAGTEAPRGKDGKSGKAKATKPASSTAKPVKGKEGSAEGSG